ncbi:MAG: flagellar hook-associated protein FlgK [Lachnospiraceae bacterium]|nr:flagellar hook-associated protein FlgK [Lachnospiraceae bacterium]
MSSLYTGVSGLTTNQRGLTATSHNLSNVETKGYVRQQVVLSDSYYSNLGTNHISYLQVGAGATVAAIRQEREVFLDKSYRQESGRKSFYESQYEASSEIEDILGETEGVAFQNSVSSLWESLSELCKEPESIVTRTSFIQTAVSFIERAEIVYKQIEDYQVSLNEQIETYVNRINEIADKIYDLNYKIRRYEAAGFENANDLRDQRNLLLDELGGYAKISYKEQANGVVTVSLEGSALVNEDLVYHIGTKSMDTNADLIEPYWPNLGEIPVFSLDPLPASAANTDIGALKGLLLARGDKVARYTDIPVAPTEEEYTEAGYFDEDGYKAAMEKYEDEVKEYNLKIDASVVMSVESQFDTLIHGIVTTINDILCPNKEVLTAEGETIQILDTENCPCGMDINETIGNGIFNRKSVDRYEKTTVTLEIDGIWQDVEVWKYNEEDPTDNYSLFTVGEIEVNSAILKDPSVIPLSKQGGTGDYSVEICEQLLTEWQTPFSTLTPNEYNKNNFDDFYTEMIGALGTKGEKFKNVFESQESLVNSVDNQRQAKIAVSSDEELTNIIKFQQGYNANARYISTLDEMLEHLLTQLG